MAPRCLVAGLKAAVLSDCGASPPLQSAFFVHPDVARRHTLATPMPNAATNGHVRLAELVAALSLGIDLGFGQPMEHVLRQCLIALRLAERIGLDEEARAAVYYAALLINVGCHADAHEQAKWFGDDIAMKSPKYDPKLQVRTLRAAVP